MSTNKAGSPLTVILLAVALLAALSLLPWGELTGNRLKDFNLLADLVPESDKTYITHEETDPALAELEAMQLSPAPAAVADSAATAAPDSVAPAPVQPLPADFTAPQAADGTVLLEDYSQGSYPARLRAALADASRRVVRVAVVGDSYIEGDIFTQNLRSLLQDTYGGSGVGYMAAHSDFPGFRQSVRQSSQGWTEADMRHIGADPVKPLWGVYFKGGPGAKVTYKGSSKPPHARSWAQSTLLFIAPGGGTITLTTDSGKVAHTVLASPDVQAIKTAGTTSKFSVASDAPGFKMLGAWLDGSRGVSVDCMSLRGNSGLTLRNVADDITRETRQWIDYDVIIVEYGINALTSGRSDYTAYTAAMVEGVEHLKRQYPGAAIIVMGIGDRGQKQGTTVGSMTTAPAMVRAQREIARRTGTFFWDTRAAMGGDGAAADWHSRALVNADYIHLNHKGGAELARIFMNALTHD